MLHQNDIKDSAGPAPRCPEADSLGRNLPFDPLYRPWGLWKMLPGNARIAFLSAALFAAITHLYAFVHILVNHDSTSTFYCTSNFLDLARWASLPATALDSNVTLPVIMGVLSVLYLAATAALTVSILNITLPLNIILVSAFITTFPPLVSVFAYASEWFLAALVLNAAGAFVVKKYRRGWIPGILLITLGLGVYQSYLAYAIGLFLFDCILSLLAKEDTLTVIKRGIKYVLVLLVSIVLFYVVLQVALRLTGIALRDYKGLNTMGFSQVGTYLASIPTAYRDYFSFFIHTDYLSQPIQYLQNILFLLGACAYGYLVFFRRSWRNPAALALQMAGFGLLPLALSITSAITSAQVNTLNQYAYVLHFVFCLKLLEQAVQDGMVQKARKALSVYALSALLCVCMLWSNLCLDNLAYVQMKVMYDNSLSLGTRITARVETVEEYTPDTPVVFIGIPNYRDLYMHASALFPETGSLIGVNNLPIGAYSTRAFFKYFVGIDFPGINGEQRALLEESDIIASMPCYPEKGSVIYYEGMILIKLSDGAIY